MVLAVRTPPLWVSYWFAFTTVIVCWDASYCFLRPRSMVGGDLSWIWWPYNAVPYGAIDLIYGFKALDAGDGFTNAQALLNLVEATLNLEYLYLRHTSPRTLHLTSADTDRPRYHGHAPLVGFAASCMTAAKTSLYFLQEYYCGWCMVGHNSTSDLIRYYIIPNGIWVIMPTIICIVLGRFIAQRLMSDTASEIAYLEWKTSSSSNPQSQSATPKAAKPLASSSVPLASSSRCTRSKTAASSSNSKSFPPVQIGAALPLTFTPTDLPVLIVGANRLAATRAFAFLEAGAEVTILSSQPLASAHEEIQYRVEKKEVAFIQQDVVDLPGWTSFLHEKEVALVCVTDTMIGPYRQRGWTSAQQISQACRTLRIPINVSDHPSLSTYTFPAVHRFAGADGNPSHLQVAVSTNGLGCRLSGRIKREIVTRLPVTVGAAVDNVGHLRLRAKSRRKSRSSSNGSGISEDDPDTPLNNPVSQLDTPSLLNGAAKQLGEGNGGEDEQLRRMRWVYQMSEYYSYEALARMTEKEMDGALATWDERPSSDKPTLPRHEDVGSSAIATKSSRGRIFLIGSGPGHPGLLTLAAHHALKSATLILSDKLVPSEILALIPPTTTLHIAKKFPGNNEGAQNELMLQALEGAKNGETVVRLKQGDPFVYGRGGEEVLYFREHGFEATVVPGVTSAIAGPEMVGIPVTQRGVSEGMVLVTGVGRAGKLVNLPGYVKPRTLVVLMGVARIGNIVSVLTNLSAPGRDGAVYPSHLPIAVIERASSPDQRVIVSTLENIEEAVKSVEERPPGMMVIGWSVLALEGKGRVDVLDNAGTDELEVAQTWLGEDRWRIREGLDDGWGEYFAGLG